jgi:hypothetical protein
MKADAILDQILDDLESSGTSSALAVAEHLRTVYSNGGESATIDAMLDECSALAEAVAGAREMLEPHRETPEPTPGPVRVKLDFPLPRVETDSETGRPIVECASCGNYGFPGQFCSVCHGSLPTGENQ